MANTKGHDANRDPISGKPGAHPIGTGAGAAGAGVTGVAESLNPTVEDAYWRANYKTRPYAKADMSYDTYQPAYKYGWESRSKYADKKYDEVESNLESGWERMKGTGKMAWSDAKRAVKDAWHRVDGNPRT